MECLQRIVAAFACTLLLTVTAVYAQSASGNSLCGNLTDPQNGEVVQNDEMMVEYQCKPDYPLVGSAMRECDMLNGTWSLAEPRCGCGDPPCIVNGMRIWNDTAVASTASYTCDFGYDLEGDVQLICNISGEWQVNNELPMCMTVLMPMPGSGSGDALTPESSTIAPSATIPPATATVSMAMTSSADVLPVETPTPTVPPTVDSPMVVIQLSFSATGDKFTETILPILKEILVIITNSSADIEVEVVEELTTANTIVALIYFGSTESESGEELTRMAFVTLSTTDNAAWAQLRADFSVMLEIVEVTDTPLFTAETPITLTLWQWIIVAAGATLMLLTLLIIISCCCRCMILRRRHKKSTPKGYKQHKLTEADIMPHRDGPKPLVEMSAFPGHPRKVARISFKPKGMLQQLSHPLTLEELEPLVDNTPALYSEYASIPSNMVNMTEVPPGAEDKNRYRDVLPNPYTRVSLFLKFGVANSDYINANYVRGYRDRSKNYIATQGPLQWTVADFWRMIWEQRVSTIIMVTSLEERGTIKCSRYWPDATVNHSTSYEDLEVRLKRRLTASNKEYTTTTFHLAHRQKMVSREVTHFWFTGWPDHGVPASAKSVVEFLMHARGVIREMPGPTVVHCSAGIGRTGVFIGADIGMQQLEEEGQVDLLKIVSTMRQDRGGMVQTRDQYTFLHKVMLEYAHYLSQVRNTYRGGMLRGGQGSFTQLQPTIHEENSDTLALIT